MMYATEFNIDTFKFWSGAVDVIEACKKAELLDLVQDFIETAFEDKTPTATEINDFVWFHLADIIKEQMDIDIYA